MENLIHLVYASKATTQFDKHAIVDLLAAARVKNQSLNITGMLAYCDGSFFQVLEGEEQTVTDLFARICQDQRHASTVTIVKEPIAARQFKNWSMGYSELLRSELAQFENMNDLFVGKTCLDELDEGRTKLLLEAFEQGRWRLS